MRAGPGKKGRPGTAHLAPVDPNGQLAVRDTEQWVCQGRAGAGWQHTPGFGLYLIE